MDCLGIRVVTSFRGILRGRDELIAELDGDDRVRPAELPAGRYATLTYRLHARRANRAQR